eukprot:scaffold128871_cov32-Tisochrysis_lutea.AAC.1
MCVFERVASQVSRLVEAILESFSKSCLSICPAIACYRFFAWAPRGTWKVEGDRPSVGSVHAHANLGPWPWVSTTQNGRASRTNADNWAYTSWTEGA